MALSVVLDQDRSWLYFDCNKSRSLRAAFSVVTSNVARLAKTIKPMSNTPVISRHFLFNDVRFCGLNLRGFFYNLHGANRGLAKGGKPINTLFVLA